MGVKNCNLLVRANDKASMLQKRRIVTFDKFAHFWTFLKHKCRLKMATSHGALRATAPRSAMRPLQPRAMWSFLCIDTKMGVCLVVKNQKLQAPKNTPKIRVCQCWTHSHTRTLNIKRDAVGTINPLVLLLPAAPTHYYCCWISCHEKKKNPAARIRQTALLTYQ